MAITQTGAMFKSFSFDNTSSRSYGVYITGQAVYNAPQRDVEMITIPARNGSFALDNGRFENIEVTYPAGIYADNETDFAQAISDFRNYLCSKVGYCRLTDEYNPNEYRMAIYKSGLEVDPVQLKAGQFEITFECKPQRWLTSGETAVVVANNGTITNPTLFESSPMLQVWGYGDIDIGNDTISINNVDLGEIPLTSGEVLDYSVILDVSNLNTGDSIDTLSNSKPTLTFAVKKKVQSVMVSSIDSVSNGTATLSASPSISTVVVTPTFTGFTYGTSNTITTTVIMTVYYNHSSISCTLTVKLIYDGADKIMFQVNRNASFPSSSNVEYINSPKHPIYYGYSTISTLPAPIYIDLDIGEAYGELNSVMLSLNNVVSLPAVLPTLKVGSTTITYDNTVTQFKVVPRWWKV